MSRKAKRVMRALLGAPWSILPEKLDAIAELVTLRARGLRFSEEEIAARINGKDQKAPSVSPPRGIAVIPLYGILAQRMNMMTEISGGTSTERFGAWFDQALADPAVSAIILDCDSPGGEVAGVAELFAKIYGARGQKPIVAIANSMAASAAYWVACAADELVCTPSGMVGSIGVITIHADTSEADAEEGVKYTVLSSGKYKAEGNSHEPLTAEGRDAIQSLLDTYYNQFCNAVAKGRGATVSAVRGGFGQGRIVTADAALAAGMIDRIATLDDTVARLGKRRGGQALAIPERAATAMPLQPAAAATATLSAPSTPVITAGPDSEDVGPRVVPVLTPAPMAKEHQMTGPAVTAEPGAANPEVARLTAELARVNGLDALKREHPEFSAKIDDWKVAGQSVEFVQTQIRKDLQAKLGAAPIVTGPGGSPALIPNEAKKPFANFGEQMVAVIQAGKPGGRRDPRLAFTNDRAIQAAASGMNESIGSEGGFFIAPELLPGVIDPVYTEDPIVSRVNRIPMSGNAVKYNVVDETSRVNGSRYGGIQMYWAAEADTATAKKPKLRQMELALKKIIGIGYLTDELEQDAPAAEALLTRAFQAELGFMLGDAIFRGTGAGQPLGFMNAGCVVSQAIEATQTIANSNTFIGFNCAKMLARVPASLWGGAIWLYQQELLPTLINATVGASGVVPLFIGAGGMTQRPFDSILGRPAFASELCEAVGTPGDIVLVVPNQYNIADKGGPQAATSLHVRFLNDENTLRITYRTDGHPLWTTSVTPYKGANARSPFVTLAVRA